MGILGAPISEDQVEAVQDEIDLIYEHFTAAVANGRDMPIRKVRKLADGRTWLAPQAQELGLLDVVRVGAILNERDKTMKTDKNQVEATAVEASPGPDLDEIRSSARADGAQGERDRLTALQEAFPDDAEFALAAYTNGLTLEQSQAQHAILTDRLAAQGETIDTRRMGTATNTPATSAPAPMGADATIGAPAPESEQDPAGEGNEDDFLAVARTYSRDHKVTMSEAMLTISQHQPELHERFLAGCKAKRYRLEGECERING
jgi:hypothetical protein